MMNPDPYTAAPPTVHAAGNVSIRPTGLTVVAVISLLAGIVGMLSGFFGLLGMLFSEMITNLANSVQPSGPGADLQQQMQAEMQAITDKYMWITLPLVLAGIAICGCLAAGGFGILATKKWARSFLRRVLTGAIVVELIKAATYGMTQMEMGPVMQEYMGKMAGSSGNPGGAAMGQMMQAMTYAGIAFLVIWTLVKVSLMAWGRLYLNKPVAKAYFGEAAS